MILNPIYLDLSVHLNLTIQYHLPWFIQINSALTPKGLIVKHVYRMEMISRRLTKIEKNEILEDFRSGLPANDLAKKYNCTANTINRTVKKLLTNDEYNSLKKESSKIKRTKIETSRVEIFNQEEEGFEVENISSGLSLESKDENLHLNDSEDVEVPNLILETKNTISLSIENNHHSQDENDEEEKEDENNFTEIAPLISDVSFDTTQQKVNYQDLDKVDLPESLYMIVDKKVELEPQTISELPEWNFLPEKELQRLAILLFPNQRDAKRNCTRNQRVIKIPNASILKISKTYLLAKGITRLILEDSLISLEKEFS